MSARLHQAENGIRKSYAKAYDVGRDTKRVEIIAWLEQWINDTWGAEIDPKWLIKHLEEGELK